MSEEEGERGQQLSKFVIDSNDGSNIILGRMTKKEAKEIARGKDVRTLVEITNDQGGVPVNLD